MGLERCGYEPRLLPHIRLLLVLSGIVPLIGENLVNED